jgi:hypothetical protein
MTSTTSLRRAGSHPVLVELAPVTRFTDQQARQFVEMLAVPAPSAPPPCPLCRHGHALEQRCASDRK